MIAQTRKSTHAEPELTFLGQMGLRVKKGETTLYIDPFLSDHPKRQFPPPMSVGELCDADLILGTHDHKDHIDRAVWPQYARNSSDAVFVVPELLLRRGLAEDLHIPEKRFLGMTHGQSIELGDVMITAVASAHEFLDRDAETGLYPYLGYIIEIGGFTLYHAGDTCRYEGLQTELKKWIFDVMVLPINGRDAKRYASGCMGNMTYQEASDLAGEVGPQLVIPGHWDLFWHNAEDPDKFTEYMSAKHPAVSVRILGSGECLKLGLNRLN